MMTEKTSAEKTVRDIRRRTRKKYSAEEKIRIVLEGLRGEENIAELCRREGLNSNVYYRWSKEFMEASDKFQTPTTRVNEMWQTDFTYFKIIAWRLCTSMSASDVSDTLDDALSFTELDEVKINHKPRLLSDNGPCYISGELVGYPEENGLSHTRGRPYTHKHKERLSAGTVR